MLIAVGLQIASILVVALAAAVMVDLQSALFVVLGGAAAIVPNGLFALRLALHRGKAPESYPVVFFLGEFVKIGLTVAILFWIVKSFDGIRWLPLLIGLIVALKMPLFALMFTSPAPHAEGVPRAAAGEGAPGQATNN